MDLIQTIGILLIIAIVYMTCWFLLALKLKRRDVVDSAWGLGFIVIALCAYLLGENESTIAKLSLLLVSIWGLRLFVHITSRNWKKKEDTRYASLGQLKGVGFWARTYLSVFVLQAALIVIINVPVVAIMQAQDITIVPLAVIGLFVWLFGIIFEAVSDYQLRRFIRAKKEGIMQSGVWRYSRHPNYFGEVTAWWGAAIVAAAYGQWWGVIGATTISVLILKISGVPLLEKRYKDNPDFQRYAKHTSVFIPLPRRRATHD